MTLVSCTKCSRHARLGEPCCPFCGGALGAPPPRRSTKRSRAAILFGAALATSACGGAQTTADEPVSEPVDQPPPEGEPDDDGATVAEYGAPSE